MRCGDARIGRGRCTRLLHATTLTVSRQLAEPHTSAPTARPGSACVAGSAPAGRPAYRLPHREDRRAGGRHRPGALARPGRRLPFVSGVLLVLAHVRSPSLPWPWHGRLCCGMSGSSRGAAWCGPPGPGSDSRAGRILGPGPPRRPVGRWRSRGAVHSGIVAVKVPGNAGVNALAGLATDPEQSHLGVPSCRRPRRRRTKATKGPPCGFWSRQPPSCTGALSSCGDNVEITRIRKTRTLALIPSLMWGLRIASSTPVRVLRMSWSAVWWRRV